MDSRSPSFSTSPAWLLRRPHTVLQPAAEQDSRFDDALDLMAKGRTTAAFRIFAALANSGHAPAARIALTMARRGTSLFGGCYPASNGERERWQRCA